MRASEAAGAAPASQVNFTFTDVNLTDTHTVTITPAAAGYYGTLTASVATDSTGGNTGTVNWTYTVNDSAVQFLAAGQTLTQTYRVTVDDGHGGAKSQNVTVTINGVNEAPTLSSSDTPALNNETAPARKI